MKGRTLDRIPEDRNDQHGRIFHVVTTRKARGSNSFHHDQPRANSRINDNYCATKLLLAGSSSAQTRQTMNTQLNINVNCHVVADAYSAPTLSQRKDISPGVGDCHLKNYKLKSVKSVSRVTQLSCVNPVSNVTNAVQTLPVWARLQNFWKTWLDLGAGPKVVQILKEGYTLPFRIRPQLTRSPTVVSCYVNPHRNSYLLEALHQLIDKNANISWVFQPTISSSQTQQQVETYIRSEQTESVPKGGEIQNGDTGNHQNVPPKRGVGDLSILQGHLLPHTNTGTVQKISQV